MLLLKGAYWRRQRAPACTRGACWQASAQDGPASTLTHAMRQNRQGRHAIGFRIHMPAKRYTPRPLKSVAPTDVYITLLPVRIYGRYSTVVRALR